jgi:hypothetical protein
VTAATAVRTPAAVVAEAHAAWHEGMKSAWRAEFLHEIITLAGALATVRGLDPGALGWGWTWPRLSDSDDRELLLAAEKAETAAGALIAAMSARAAKSGTEGIGNEVAGVKS